MPQVTSAAPVLPDRASAQTRRAHEALSEGISSGRLPAGAWLREGHLAAELGLSRTPVREALRVLAAEGLVELVHNRGARVVTWSAQDVDETYRLRALLEGEGAALAARRATEQDVGAMAAAQARYEERVAGGAEPVEQAGCNDAFHAAVLGAAGSARLTTLVGLVTRAPLVARALRAYSEDDLRRSVLAHRDVVTAVRAGDDALARAAMSSHILAARHVALAGAATPG